MARVAFIGIGNMGYPMARNLVAAGHEVRAFDLSARAMENAEKAGASAASSIADALTGAEVVMTMLPEGRHVRAVYTGGERDGDGIIGLAPGDALLVDCSTIDVASAREVAGKAAAAGYEMLDAPVSGGVMGAEAGTLTFMVGGTESGFERARPILGAMGSNLVHAGDAGNGQAAKICNNMMAGIAMIGMAEVCSLGEALGLDARKLFDVLSTSSGQAWVIDKLFPVPGIVESAPVNRDFAPGFKASLMAKDLGLAERAAEETHTGTPLGATAASLFRMLCQHGAGELDCSAIYRLVHGDL
jgi:3-hydroxyisobutyrate dehydrogenase